MSTSKSQMFFSRKQILFTYYTENRRKVPHRGYKIDN